LRAPLERVPATTTATATTADAFSPRSTFSPLVSYARAHLFFCLTCARAGKPGKEEEEEEMRLKAYKQIAL